MFFTTKSALHLVFILNTVKVLSGDLRKFPNFPSHGQTPWDATAIPKGKKPGLNSPLNDPHLLLYIIIVCIIVHQWSKHATSYNDLDHVHMKLFCLYLAMKKTKHLSPAVVRTKPRWASWLVAMVTNSTVWLQHSVYFHKYIFP